MKYNGMNRLILPRVGDEETGNWSNEQKKDLNDEAEVTSHTPELILEQRQE